MLTSASLALAGTATNFPLSSHAAHSHHTEVAFSGLTFTVHITQTKASFLTKLLTKRWASLIGQI